MLQDADLRGWTRVDVLSWVCKQGVVGSSPTSSTRRSSSLKERCRVKGGFVRGLGAGWACVTGVSCFPVAARVRGGRLGGSRTGRSPAAGGGAEGVLEVTGREPDDLAAGNGSRGHAGCSVVSGRPMFRVIRCGQCRWLHSSLRVAPARAGEHGAGSRQGGQAGSSRLAPAPPVTAGQKTWRPRAWPLARGKLFMPPALAWSRAVLGRARAGSGSARRAGRSRSG